MSYTSTETAAIWAQCEKALRQTIPPRIKAHGDAQGYLIDCRLGAPKGMEDLTRWVRRQLKKSASPAKATPTKRRQHRDESLAYRLWALSHVYAAEARGLDAVKEWRHSYLDTKFPLPAEQVQSWIEGLEHTGELTPPESGWPHFGYTDEHGRTRAALARGPVLASLHSLATRLSERYAWQTDGAISFILCDDIPPTIGIQHSITGNTAAPGTIHVSLRVSLAISPKELAATYAKIRAQVLQDQERYRPLKASTCRKIAFAAAHDWDYKKAFAEYRRSRPEDYPPGAGGLRTFKGHVKASLRRLQNPANLPIGLDPVYTGVQEPTKRPFLTIPY